MALNPMLFRAPCVLKEGPGVPMITSARRGGGRSNDLGRTEESGAAVHVAHLEARLALHHQRRGIASRPRELKDDVTGQKGNGGSWSVLGRWVSGALLTAMAITLTACGGSSTGGFGDTHEGQRIVRYDVSFAEQRSVLMRITFLGPEGEREVEARTPWTSGALALEAGATASVKATIVGMTRVSSSPLCSIQYEAESLAPPSPDGQLGSTDDSCDAEVLLE